LVNPVTVISPLPGPLTVPLMPPGDDVATYDVIAAPPSCAGAVNVIVACSKPAVAVPMIGASEILVSVVA